MKTFKKQDGSLWAFEKDGSQDHLITIDMVQVSDAEADSIRNPMPDPEALLAAKLQSMDEAIRQRLNVQANSMEFESIATAILAASLPLGEFRQSDGAKLHLWAARTWQKAKEIRDAFLAGERPEPTWTDVESELPSYPIE